MFNYYKFSLSFTQETKISVLKSKNYSKSLIWISKRTQNMKIFRRKVILSAAFLHISRARQSVASWLTFPNRKRSLAPSFPNITTLSLREIVSHEISQQIVASSCNKIRSATRNYSKYSARDWPFTLDLLQMFYQVTLYQ